jgi:hypothetical protein
MNESIFTYLLKCVVCGQTVAAVDAEEHAESHESHE